VSGNPAATIVADLTKADLSLIKTYDYIILTKFLQLIYDFPAALSHVERILKPEGVVLVTLSGHCIDISPRYEPME